MLTPVLPSYFVQKPNCNYSDYFPKQLYTTPTTHYNNAEKTQNIHSQFPHEVLWMLRTVTTLIIQGLPSAALSFPTINIHQALTTGFGNRIIPHALESRREQHITQQGMEFPDYVFFDVPKFSQQQLDDLWDIVSDIPTRGFRFGRIPPRREWVLLWNHRPPSAQAVFWGNPIQVKNV